MALDRTFVFRSTELPDPDPNMSPDEVRLLYAHEYPELLNAAVIFSDPVNGVQEYNLVEKTDDSQVTEAPRPERQQSQKVEFKTSIGRKG